MHQPCTRHTIGRYQPVASEERHGDVGLANYVSCLLSTGYGEMTASSLFSLGSPAFEEQQSDAPISGWDSTTSNAPAAGQAGLSPSLPDRPAAWLYLHPLCAPYVLRLCSGFTLMWIPIRIRVHSQHIGST